ncbi:MAG: hypothetical protein FWC29_00645 [Methanomassiliicoccaceae archaeon]|nr:hypothetical protein [Methanomassiliicoccaceae archaeon]
MPYKMSKEAKDMYKSMTQDWNYANFTMWDFYYFCFSVGFSKRKLTSENKLTGFSNTMEIHYFVFRSEVVAALVSTEIERKGLTMSAENIIAEFRELTDPIDSLSPKGQEILNYYAEGGFRIIAGESQSIRDPVEFMTICEKIVSDESFLDDHHLP